MEKLTFREVTPEEFPTVMKQIPETEQYFFVDLVAVP